MSIRTRDAAKRGRASGPFIPLPMCVLRSQHRRGLSAIGSKLFMDLVDQLQVNAEGPANNGDLTVTWSIMAQRGWKSRDSLERARKELLEKELIILTRQGGRNLASLYAFTFFAINECRGKLDVRPTVTPPKVWSRENWSH